ncbi:MAG TPA: hypothetical protein VHP83_26605 [Aggregatilineaceae bacterium]|nr:hypothetical protein [Aggregatilineaceae bacterium]
MMSDPIQELAEAQRREEARDNERLQRYQEAAQPHRAVHHWAAEIRYILTRLLIVEVVIFAIVALLYYVILQGRDTREFSMGVLIVGALIFSIGPFSLIGTWGNTRSWTYQYARTMEDNTAQHRFDQDRSDVQKSVGLFLPSILIGLITIILAVLVDTLL